MENEQAGETYFRLHRCFGLIRTCFELFGSRVLFHARLLDVSHLEKACLARLSLPVFLIFIFILFYLCVCNLTQCVCNHVLDACLDNI